VHGSFTLSWGCAGIRGVREWVAALMVVVAVVHRVFLNEYITNTCLKNNAFIKHVT
jgi:hypothetical protein